MHSKFHPRPSFEQIKVGIDLIPFSPSAPNVGVIMDETFDSKVGMNPFFILEMKGSDQRLIC